MVRTRIPLFALPFLLLSAPSFAQSPEPSPPVAEADRLRAELAALKLEFANRLTALEERLKSVESSASAAAAASSVPSTPTPVQSSKVFNPDIAVIGDFIGAAGKAPGAEPSLEMHEAEVSLQAIVDPYARADVFLTFGPEEVGIEEAFITFPTLPGGFLAKIGRFRDAFGKMNAAHNHVLPFPDRPLMTQNLLGGEEGLGDSGISVSRLFPNSFAFLEATGQVFRGESAIFTAEKRENLAYVSHLRAYRDLSESTNLDLGGSFANGHNDARSTTRLWGADATLRYRPLRRSIYTHLLARTELTWSRRRELDGPSAFGAYGYLEYQFARRWTAGARFDVSDRALDSSIRDKGGSFLLTYAPSEFSLVRGQFRQTRFGDTSKKSNEFLLQFLFSIGAHGAHPF